MSESVKTPAPARRGPPRALPIILALALPILYSLFAAPLFDSAANPDDNSEYNYRGYCRTCVGSACFDESLLLRRR